MRRLFRLMYHLIGGNIDPPPLRDIAFPPNTDADIRREKPPTHRTFRCAPEDPRNRVPMSPFIYAGRCVPFRRLPKKGAWRDATSTTSDREASAMGGGMAGIGDAALPAVDGDRFPFRNTHRAISRKTYIRTEPKRRYRVFGPPPTPPPSHVQT